MLKSLIYQHHQMSEPSFMKIPMMVETPSNSDGHDHFKQQHHS